MITERKLHNVGKPLATSFTDNRPPKVTVALARGSRLTEEAKERAMALAEREGLKVSGLAL